LRNPTKQKEYRRLGFESLFIRHTIGRNITNFMPIFVEILAGEDFS
jgi:hypothetical protein